jgi:3-oxoadipate enol-lactonase
VNGVRLAYDAYGGPVAPPLLLVHGLYGNRHLGGLIDLFSDHCRVIAYDARGHGDSDKPAHYTLADHGHDLLELIRALGYKRAAVLGVSMGRTSPRRQRCSTRRVSTTWCSW